MLPETAMANTIPGVDPLVAEAGSPLLPLALLFTTGTPSAAPEVSTIQPVSNQISEIPTTSAPTIREPEALLIAHAEEYPAIPESAEKDAEPSTTVEPSTSTGRSTSVPDEHPTTVPATSTASFNSIMINSINSSDDVIILITSSLHQYQ